MERFVGLYFCDVDRTNPKLAQTIHALESAARSLDAGPDRMTALNALAQWIADQSPASPTDLIYICTHNSRRSHMGQIWAQAAAWHAGLDDVRTFSGGTEATAFYVHAIEALRDCGVSIEEIESGVNPLYQVRLQSPYPPFEAFSKVFSEGGNPTSEFAAVMTCDSADEACPVVSGAAARFAIPYQDPKVSDGTGRESAIYRERALQIGAECFYVMMRAAEIRAAQSAQD